jgi:hypothetical protein
MPTEMLDDDLDLLADRGGVQRGVLGAADATAAPAMPTSKANL